MLNPLFARTWAKSRAGRSIQTLGVNIAMTTTFDEVPADASGNPMLVAACEDDFSIYIEWLADYLYRPNSVPEEPLSQQRAGLALIEIEAEIAAVVWNDPYDDYPPEDRLPPNLARHADILHRKSISLVLSRVPDHAIRLKLLQEFYAELNRDLCK